MKGKHKKTFDKSDGIYYIVCINGKWKVEAYRADRCGDVDHTAIWEKHLSPYLARIFELNKEDASLLKLSYAGFPRGRIVKIGVKYVVYHGNDYKKFVSEDEILVPFGIGKAEFKFDDHEWVIREHREVVRGLLGIEESWVAV